jgi:Aminotransferase class-III
MLYTFPHELDYEVGRKIVAAVPGIEQVRFANSGSEATQAAMRLARAFTGKDRILKREGSYNGFLDCHAFSHHPPFDAAGYERFPRTVPSLGGIARTAQESMIVGCFNDLDAVETLVSRNAGQLAAVQAEPILQLQLRTLLREHRPHAGGGRREPRGDRDRHDDRRQAAGEAARGRLSGALKRANVRALRLPCTVERQQCK